jgi:hypothetical protein
VYRDEVDEGVSSGLGEVLGIAYIINREINSKEKMWNAESAFK